MSRRRAACTSPTAALRLATPDSPWARRRYRGEQLERSRRRFRPDRPAARRRDCLLDLIGGAPSRDAR